jgi:murein DD-endopeptidase MepM/ murein hydrolase activator NlpD
MSSTPTESVAIAGSLVSSTTLEADTAAVTRSDHEDSSLTPVQAKRDHGRALAAMVFVGILLGAFWAGIRSLTGDANHAVIADAATAKSSQVDAEVASASERNLAHAADAAVNDAASGVDPRASRLRELVTPERELASATVGKRTFSGALSKAGVSANELASLTQCFKGIRSFDRTRPHDEFRTLRERGTRALVGFEYEAGLELYFGRLEGGEFSCGHTTLRVDYVHQAGLLNLGSGDVRNAAVRAGFDASLADVLDVALDGHVDLDHVHIGAQVRVVALEERVNGTFSDYPAVLGLEYLPARKPRGILRIYGFSSPEARPGVTRSKPVYYDSKAEKLFSGAFSMPIPFARVTSKFNPRRMHPVLHTIMPHNGVDYGGSTGTPVYAVAEGTLKFAADSGPCGNMVQVEHAAGLLSSYCHLSRFAAGLQLGQKVARKQLVGYVGQTGRVTGPHLHFAVKRDGKFIDPLSLKLGGLMRLGKSDKVRFDAEKAQIDGELDAIALTASTDAGAVDEAPDDATPDAADEAEPADP